MTIALEITIPRIFVALAVLGPPLGFLVFNHYLTDNMVDGRIDDYFIWARRATYFFIAIIFTLLFALMMKV